MVDSALLILDEPMAGLDMAGREELLMALDHVADTAPELAIALVTHHLDEVPSSTSHALLLADGIVTFSGKAEQVLTLEKLSKTFAFPAEVEQRRGRWTSRAKEVHE